MWLPWLPGASLSVVFVRAVLSTSRLPLSKGISPIAFASPLWGIAVHFKIASWFKMASCLYSWPPFLGFLNWRNQRIAGYHSQKTSEIIYHFVDEKLRPREGQDLAQSHQWVSAELGWILGLLPLLPVLGLDPRPVGPPAAWISVHPAPTTTRTQVQAALPRRPAAGALSRGWVPQGSQPPSWHLSSADWHAN